MNTIKLTDEQLEEVQRAVMRSILRDLESASDQIEQLETVAPWPADGTKSSNAQTMVTLLRERLDLLDAIGWPRDETRGQWETRMQAVTTDDT